MEEEYKFHEFSHEGIKVKVEQSIFDYTKELEWDIEGEIRSAIDEIKKKDSSQ